MDISGNWHYGLLSKPLDGKYRGKVFISNSAGMPLAYEVRPETVTEYTGLKDKNGVEIYEGDIVEIENYEFPVITKCEYRNAGFTLIAKDHGEWTRQLYHQTDRLEVIGNIYEHKSLL